MKKFIKSIFFFIIVIGTTKHLLAQSDPQFSQYMYINSYINPASTAIDDNTNIAFLIRYQWLGTGSIKSNVELNGSPLSQLVNASTKLKQLNSGIGLYLLNESLGPLNNINAKFNYAYHFNVAGGKLGVGLGIGIYNQQINTARLTSNNPNDPLINYLQRNQNEISFDVNAGLFYQRRNFFFGVSSNHINSPIYNDSTKAFISRQYYITGGYSFVINDLFSFNPSLLFKTNFTQLNQSNFDLTALLKYNKDQAWAGMSYRSGLFKPDALIALLGISLIGNNTLKLGYAFDLTVLGSAAKALSSHEIMVTYSKPVQDILPKPIIRTPRYRF